MQLLLFHHGDEFRERGDFCTVFHGEASNVGFWNHHPDVEVFHFSQLMNGETRLGCEEVFEICPVSFRSNLPPTVFTSRFCPEDRQFIGWKLEIMVAGTIGENEVRAFVPVVACTSSFENATAVPSEKVRVEVILPRCGERGMFQTLKILPIVGLSHVFTKTGGKNGSTT